MYPTFPISERREPGGSIVHATNFHLRKVMSMLINTKLEPQSHAAG